MFKNKFVLGIIGLGIVAAFIYMLGSAPSYPEKFQKETENYKRELLSMNPSPLKDVNSNGISFFEPDENWIFEADFQKSNEDREFTLNMTDSSTATATLAGYATLKVNGQAFRLMVFDEGANYTLPFKDATNGNQTYGGGRYINIDKNELAGKKITLDFNKSRNYYCAYSEKWACPVPPFENTLSLAVTAGEKNFKKS